MYIFTHTRTSTYKNININWQAQIHSYIQVYNVYIHIYIYISICVCTNIYNKQFVYISMDDIKSSSVFFFLPVRFPLYLPPVLGSDFFPPLSFLSLQKGAEHWIAAQFTCPRWGLYRGMQASKRGRERERERGGGMRSSIPPAPQLWETQPINLQHGHQQQHHSLFQWLLLKGQRSINWAQAQRQNEDAEIPTLIKCWLHIRKSGACT